MDINTPVALGFSQLKCIEDTNEWDDDEPYCVIFVVDNSNPLTPLPPALAFRTNVFEKGQSVESGDVRKQWLPIWGVAGSPGTPAPINAPNDIIVLVAVMENDSSEPSSVTSTVQATLTASLTAARASGLNRVDTVAKLIDDMKGAIALGAASGGIDKDEQIDEPKELILTANELQQARTGHTVTKVLTFKDSGEDAEYRVSFVLRPSKQWKGWVDLGGILTSSPVAASWAAFRLDIFARRQDNGLGHKRWNGEEWSEWRDLGGTFKDAPGAVSWGSNRIDVFVRGMDDHIGHKWWNGSEWQGWEDLGGIVTSGPAVASWGPNRLDVFARGENNRLWHKRWNGEEWSEWRDLGGRLTSAPAAVSWGPNRIDVFVRGFENQLAHKRWNGKEWSEWRDLGGTFKDAPGAVSWGSNRIDVFVRGMDDHLGHMWWG